MKKNRTKWIALTALLFSFGLFCCTNLPTLNISQEGIDQESEYQTAVARNGDILISASGSGQVVSASEIELEFDQSGTIIDVLVGVGEPVKAGDVLIQLKTDRTEAQLAAKIAATELAVIQAQGELNDLIANAEVEAAQALIEIEDAQLALEELTDLAMEKALALQKVALAEEATADLEMLLYIYNSSPSADEIYTLYASWLFKQENLEDVTKQVETTILKIKGSRNEAQKSRYKDQLLQLNLQLANQTLLVEDAIDKLNSIDDRTDALDVYVVETQLATAEAELAAARRELEVLEAGPKPGDVSLAEAILATAVAEWERVKNGPSSEDITKAETQLEKARLELEIIKGGTTIVDLIAPFDSTVITINAAIGDRLTLETGSSGSDTETSDPQTEEDIFEEIFFGSSSSSTDDDAPLIKIADLSNNLLEVYLDETDLNLIAVGSAVEVVFDAFPDEVFTGEIVEVSPQLETVSNVQAIPTLIRLDETSYAKPNILPIGLNASVEVIAAQATDVVLVPVEALVEVRPGEFEIYVIENNLPQLRKITIGLIDYTSAEIIEGLSPGDTVAIGYADTTGK